MKKKFLTAFLVLFLCFGLSAFSPSFFEGTLITAFDDDEDEESSSSEEEDETSAFAEKNNSETEDEEEKVEEDPFAKGDPVKSKKSKKEEKDDFVQTPSKDVYPDPDEDDFVVEKREKGVTHQYKEPDLGKVIVSTYLYTEPSVRSKKLFELYEKDDLVILDERDEFYHVEFLGKEGWVPRGDVRLEKWYTYRISIELSGGTAYGGGDFKNFDVVGNYSLKLNVAILQDFVAGLELRGMSLDTDNIYYGGGLALRYYIHGIRTGKTSSALTASAGYLCGLEKMPNSSTLKFFGGPYASVSLDYFFRVWEYIAIGVGGDFTYTKMYGSAMNFNLSKQFFEGGGHLSLMFNIMR